MTPSGPLRGVVRWGPIGVALLAIAVYANSLGNGFAFDDGGVIVDNPVVTAGDPVAALAAPYWAGEAGVGRLYRPVTQAAFAIQWELFGGAALGFHLVNVGLHVVASLLVLFLCGWLLSGWTGSEDRGRERLGWGAVAGGAIFAVHPVHVEPVANVVGQAELWAAVGVLGAVLLHVRSRRGGSGVRIAGTLGVAALYALAFGAKESAIVLPAILLLVEAAESTTRAEFRARLWKEFPRFALLATVAATLLVARIDVLGALSGEDVSAVFIGLGPLERVAHALPAWVEYLRLLVWPVDLSADYDPGVIYPASGPSMLQVGAGSALGIAAVAAVLLGWLRARAVAVSAGWFLITIALASNLLIATGSLMAERTLYLPSVALAFAVALIVTRLLRVGPDEAPLRARRVGWGLVLVVALLSVRTLDRNPTWFSSFTVMQTLAEEHPESWRASMARAQGLVHAGDEAAAAEAYEAGVVALPTRFDLVSETGVFFKERRQLDRARPYLESAVALQPARPSAWVLLGELELLEGRFREAHAVATRGISAAVPQAELWAVLSESYVGGGLLDAAVRARRASLALESTATGWSRLAELLEAVGAPEDAIVDARRRAVAESR